jgi:hypothetical protein
VVLDLTRSVQQPLEAVALVHCMPTDTLVAEPLLVSGFALRLAEGALLVKLAVFLPFGLIGVNDLVMREKMISRLSLVPELVIGKALACEGCQVSALINNWAGNKAASPTVQCLLPQCGPDALKVLPYGLGLAEFFAAGADV